jgi:cell division protein FtsL
VNFEKKQYTGNISPAKTNNLSRADKITLCALSAAAVGIGIAFVFVKLKKKG